MRGLTGVALFLVVTACQPPKTPEETQAEQRAVYEAANRERDEYSARSRERAAVKRAANNERLEAEDAKRNAGRQAQLDAKIRERDAQMTADCASDRESRLAEVKHHEHSLAHINELIQWEIDHCRSIDASKPVTRTVQDSRGVYHTFEGRDRGVDFVCDAKKPAEIEHTRADNLAVYRVPYKVEKRNDMCRTWDERAAASVSTP
jgi:hypothetical protein